MKRYSLRRQNPIASSGIEWEASLNPQQLAVVTAGTGPLLVIAGAGTGKTHTLTYRVARLIASGVQPDNILLLTFTNKAAREMTGRVAELVGENVRNRLWGGTFHHVGNRLMRRHAARLGYPENFSVLDPEDVGILMKHCVHEAGIDVSAKRFPRGAKLGSLFSYCINTQRTVEEVLEAQMPEHLADVEEFREVFRVYQTRKLEIGAMDFDDLLLNWKRLLVEFPDLRASIAGEFEHVLVDEYQDTNAIQGELIDLVSSVHGNLMVVGDDCQSIYRFRGAEYKNILEFPQRYPNCREYRLELNYRSTPQILELTNRSIANNVNQFQKTLTSGRGPGERPALLRIKDVYQQAAFVCQRILDLADEGSSLSDIAVLYRSHYQATELQVELARYGIPFVIRSGVRFFEQAHIKDVLSYLRFIYNPRDELAFLRLAEHHTGIGGRRARELWDAIRNAPDPLAAATDPQLGHAILPKRAQGAWNKASGVLATLRSQRLTAPPTAMLDTVVSGPYRDYLEQNFENSENRLLDLEQLGSYADQYGDLDRFLGEVALMTTVAGQDIVVGGDTPDEYVTLSSIHQAKGLEWKHCFVLWLSDGHFPSTSSLGDEDGMEEERRLFYVATTRAKEDLYLCHVLTHKRRDHRMVVLRESPFLEELRCSDPVDEPWESWQIEEEF